MKRLSELTPEDLIASKVWKFWRDAQSIEQVEAYPTEVLSEDDQQDYVAATHFTFANGESCLGVAGLSIEQVFPLHLECLVRVGGRTVVISIHASDLVSPR